MAKQLLFSDAARRKMMGGVDILAHAVGSTLGPTGRNVAAGMSGGIAYLLDVDPAKINPELVDIESLADDEVVWLGEIINTHRTLTSSLVAEALLDDWPASAERFVRIMPRDYRRVLELRAEAATRGLDADELIMEASHG